MGTFCLPSLIFGSLCKINLFSVNWKFFSAILVTKAVIFIAILLVTYVIGRKVNRAGLYAIFTTQSNDFAVGLPIVQAIYGLSNPQFQDYVYLLAPISLVILNPIGIIFLEIGKQQESNATSRLILIWNVFKSISTNPIIFMTIFGIFGNLIFGGTLPAIIDGFLTTLGNAFGASALFLLGLNMVSRTRQKPKGSVWIAPVILIITKTIVMPLIAREIVSTFNVGANATATQEWSSFAFLYGTFPPAPGAFVYAVKYDVQKELLATTLVASTFVSAPIMFISARLLSIKSVNPSDYIQDLDNFLLDISIVSLFACLWVIFVLINSKKCREMPHLLTLLLTVSQACGCIGAILWSVSNCHHGWKLYLEFIFFAFGVYASRINTALIGITLLMLMRRTQRCTIIKMRPYMIVTGVLTPILLVLVMLTVIKNEVEPHGDKTDPNFQYGNTQAMVSLILLSWSFLTTILSLIFGQRSSRRFNEPVSRSNSEDDPSRYLLEDSINAVENSEALIEEIEDLSGPPSSGCSSSCRARVGAGRYRCDSEQRDYNSSLLERYAVPPAREALDTSLEDDNHDSMDLIKHTILLLCLCCSMFVGIAICLWTLVMEKMTGIYIELLFLDGFLNFGQGLFTFAIFGLDAKYVLVPLRKWLRRRIYGQESLNLPHWEDLETETKMHCQQFLKHHMSNCMETLVRDVRHNLMTFKAVFRGSELVDWLLEADLVSNRMDGVVYARHLVKGRVLRHIDNYLDFYDDHFLYTFAR